MLSSSRFTRVIRLSAMRFSFLEEHELAIDRQGLWHLQSRGALASAADRSACGSCRRHPAAMERRLRTTTDRNCEGSTPSAAAMGGQCIDTVHLDDQSPASDRARGLWRRRTDRRQNPKPRAATSAHCATIEGPHRGLAAVAASAWQHLERHLRVLACTGLTLGGGRAWRAGMWPGVGGRETLLSA